MIQRSILITGGAGFIGSHLVKLLVNKYPNYLIVNVDALTYSGNLANLIAVENAPNYQFIKADILDFEAISTIIKQYNIDSIIHLAAESHVDRSISNPTQFIETNVNGTLNLLNIANLEHQKGSLKMFYHVSTDEVYGSLGADGLFTETTAYNPNSPYSASKAASDHLVNAYHHTYGLPTIISNCSNNYGSHQFPEKLIPLVIHNIKNKKPIPVYGNGQNIRDWLFVEDHCSAIDLLFHKGTSGQKYNIGGNNEWTNLEVVKLICNLMDTKLNRTNSIELITYVTDRAGHDFRYAIDSTKIQNQFGWQPSLQFEEGISKTIDWYLGNSKWLDTVINGDYLKYYESQYTTRG